MKNPAGIILAAVVMGCFFGGAACDVLGNDGGGIRPWDRNPRYWQYNNKPVLLLGGSKTDHIFLAEGLKEHLDEIAEAGANYVRNTMSQRESLDLKAHKRLADGKFDMDQWNAEYWKRFADCLRWCQQRDIVMQIEVWDRFDFSQEQWQNSPWRPGNNINYTNEQTGLAEKYAAQPWRDRQPFFHSIPGMAGYKKQYDIIRRYQERFVEKMLSYSLRYPNVLYCMNNETSTAPAWGRYWMKFIEEKAAREGANVYVTDMFDDGWKPQTSAKLRQAFDDSDTYDFIDVSQVNSRTFNQDHWTNILWLVERNGKNPRPLNNTKIYSGGETTWGSGTAVDGVERFWRNLIAGAASCRFHRPEAGIGLNETAKGCIGAARKIEERVKFWDVVHRMDLLSGRSADEAYLGADEGKQYILYFTDGGSVELDLEAYDHIFSLKWVNISTGQWGNEATVKGGGKVTIEAPGKGGWAAAIVRQ